MHFAAGIDQHQCIFGKCLVVLDVVQNAGVAAAGDDRRVGVPGRAAPAEFVPEFGLEFVFDHPWTAGTHGAGVRR